jgi:hypothetical protein
MNIRSITTIIDEVLTEGGRPVEPAARTAVVLAVVQPRSSAWTARSSTAPA